jgi:hypothetical protein
LVRLGKLRRDASNFDFRYQTTTVGVSGTRRNELQISTFVIKPQLIALDGQDFFSFKFRLSLSNHNLNQLVVADVLASNFDFRYQTTTANPWGEKAFGLQISTFVIKPQHAWLEKRLKCNRPLNPV